MGFKLAKSAFICLGLLTATCTALPQAVAPLAGGELNFVVEELGKQVLAPGFGGLSRDGGGGGKVNGKNVIIFSDTENQTINCGPIPNTIVYSNTYNPRQIIDFGTKGCPRLGVPYIEEEFNYTLAGKGLTRVVIWPQSAIIPLPGDASKGLAVAPVAIQSAPGAEKPSGNLYNTLYTIAAPDQGPVVTRVVPKLWNADQVLYGTFTTVAGQDGYIYFIAAEGVWGTQNSGLKLARATSSTYMNKDQWQFWTGSAWVNTPPAVNEAKPFLPGFFSSGDIFWNNYLGTYIAIYFTAFVDSTFWYRYAIPDANGKVSMTGQWSKEYVLKDTKYLRDTAGGYSFNYAGHAYPNYDSTGRTVVLSMTLSDGVTPYFLRTGFTR